MRTFRDGPGGAVPATGPLDVVTGAFSYSGGAIARELAAAGRRVRTLTGHPSRAPEGTGIEVRPLDFTDPSRLAQSLEGAEILYNTYWVRFAHGAVDHENAVANSKRLFEAARTAGVRRIVHVSITNPSTSSPYPYFRGKAEVEKVLANVGVPYAVARPAILFGEQGVLINNIAWLLRHLPVFAVGGRGDYRIRAIHVDDLARLCVRLAQRPESVVVDAVGPESVTFRQLVEAIRAAVGSRSFVVGVPGSLVPVLADVVGLFLRDRLLTREEYLAMADGLADSDAETTGEVALTDWIREQGQDLGRTYANELKRHFDAAAGARR
jgi:NADH dehydrogenase